MQKLLRQLNKNLWASCANAVEWGHSQCPSKLVKEFVDGTSVWVLSEKVKTERIVSAIASSQKSVSDIIFVEIDTDKLRDIGLDLKNTSGETCDDEVNSTHREIFNLTPPRISQLACLVRNCDHKSMESNRILGAIAQYCCHGQFDNMKFVVGQRKVGGTIIERLVEKKLLAFSSGGNHVST